jgi:heme/copper-type cytochrome/quinol oxidase subunit 1
VLGADETKRLSTAGQMRSRSCRVLNDSQKKCACCADRALRPVQTIATFWWMKRAPLIALLVVGVLLAGGGVAMNATPFSGGSYGWTAYSPLSATAYLPGGLWRPVWRSTIGLVLLAVGAGTTGAALVALVLRRPEPEA